MTFELLRLAIGLGMLVAGGEFFVVGAVGVGRRMRLSSWVIGATIVAFATSAPELAVNVIAALEDHTELAFGNVIGSNMANIGLILGAAAIWREVPLGKHGLERRSVLLTLAAVIGLAVDTSLRGASARVGWPEACLLLLGFAYYMRRLLNGGRDAAEIAPDPALDLGWFGPTFRAATGLALLTLGGDLAVDGAMGVASFVEIPAALVGLSAVAIGTSLPELFASISALRRGEGELLLGTIIGSNLFNLLLVLSVTALAHPIAIPRGGLIDLAMMAGFSAFLLPIGSRVRSLTRVHGVVLLLAYLGYLTLRVGLAS